MRKSISELVKDLETVAGGLQNSHRAVLFDLDGTLLQTRIDFPAMRAALSEIGRGHGLIEADMPGTDVLTRAAAGVRALRRRGTDPSPFSETLARALEEIEVAGCRDAGYCPGVPDVLEILRAAGLKIGIVTRNCSRVVQRLLAQLPLPHDALVTRDDTPRVKPDPLHVELALQALGCSAAHAWMVGDHPMDVLAGRAAGTRTLGLLTSGAPEDYFAPVAPDGVLTSLRELPAWIFPSS